MRPLLGLSIGPAVVHAVLNDEGVIGWAGSASHASPAELAETIARLAGEAGRAVRRVRVVLERDLVQLRTVSPVPPLPPKAWRRYVTLDAPRLFRQNGAPLVTDAVLVPGPALLAAAAPEPVLKAVIDGCAQAGIVIESFGPAALVLPAALRVQPNEGDLLFPNGNSTEMLTVVAASVVRSRRIPGTEGARPDWAPALLPLKIESNHYASAYAATCAVPALELWPEDVREGRTREVKRRLLKLAIAAGAIWLLAGAVWVARLAIDAGRATQALAALSPVVDSALAVRREIDAGSATLATIARARAHRSRLLALLTQVALALGDSAYLVAVRVEAGGTVRLAGLAPSATRVVALLSRLPDLTGVQIEGAVTREAVAGNRELERFNLVAQVSSR